MITRLKSVVATLLSVATIVPALTVSLPAKAAITSTVIKGPNSSTLYWYASNGKRYVFPNANTYYTWYGDFLNVNNVTESELSAITLAGNVTYRPGAKLIKVESDPKVYAVARYGVLRHVTSESLASSLYGSDWRSKVQDIPAVFFTNYTVANPIYNAYDFSVANEYNGVTNPNDSITGLSSNTNSSYGFTLNASRTSINPGEAVELTVSSYSYSTTNSRIDLYDTRNTSSVVRSCYGTTTCTQTVYPQRNGSETTVQYYAVLRDGNGNFVANAYGPVIYFGNVNGTGTTNYGTRFTTTVSRTSVNAGESLTLTATHNGSTSLPSSYRIEIQDPRTASAIQTCWNTTPCTTSLSMTVNGGITNIIFHARLIDNNGSVIADEWFPTVNITSNGANMFTSGSSRLDVDRSSINAGETLTLTAYASNLNTSASDVRMELYRESNNSLVDTCYDSLTCTFRPVVWNDGTNGIRFYVIVKSDFGQQLPAAYSSRVTVNGSTNLYGTPSITYPAQNQVLTAMPRALTITWNGSARRHQVEVTCGGYCYPVVGQSTSIAYLSTDSYRNWVNTELTGDDTVTVRIRAINEDGSYGSWSNGVSFRFNTYGQQTNVSTYGSTYISSLDLVANPTSIASGEYLRLTANAYTSGAWSFSGNRLEIRDLRNNMVVKTCYDQSWCVAELYPQRNGSESSVSYGVRLYDRNGAFVREATSATIWFTGTSSNTNASGSLTGSTDLYYAPTMARNTQGYLTASITNANLPTRDLVIRILENETVLGTCLGGSVCSVARAIGNTSVNTSIRAEFGTASQMNQLTRTINLIVN
jgi:hypothetical protein